MEKKDDRIDILVLIVMFISALLFIVSLTGLFFEGYTGSVCIGSSILLSASLVCRAMQWAKEQ